MAEESRELRKSRRIRWLRRLLLVATLVAVAVVVAVYLAGREEREGPTKSSLAPPRVEPEEGMVTVGEGFERTFTEGNRPVLTVRGESFSLDRQGIAYLTGVGLTVYQDDGSHYQLEGTKARFDMEKKEARLVGAVKLSAPDGLVLTTSELQLTDHGHRVKSSGEVHLTLGDAYRGRADRLDGRLKSRRFVLSGAVDIESAPGAERPFRLRTRTLTVDRTRKLLHTTGWAVLSHGPDRVSAAEMVLFFADDERTLRFLRAHRRVRGALRTERTDPRAPADRAGGQPPPGPPGLVAFQTRNLGLLFAEDGREPKQVDLDKGPGGRALLRSLHGPKRPHYDLSAPMITGYFENGVPVRAEAGKGVTVTEAPPSAGAEEAEVAAVEEEPPEAAEEAAQADAQLSGEAAAGGAPGEEETQQAEEPARPTGPGPGRRATGEHAIASFGPAGGLSKVELDGEVVLTDTGFRGSGSRAVFGADDDEAELFGKPALVESDRGRMEAPHILYTRADGLLHGTDGVRARLEEADDTALGGTPLTRGDGPVRVEADEGYLRDQPRSFLFHGRVRAWRGENLLVADDLSGDDAEHRLRADGKVRTLWTPEDQGAGAASSPPEGGPATEKRPLEATSDQMTYRQDERLLVYTGNVTAKQEERTLTCHEMEIHLAAEGGMERLICTGDVHVDDPGQGRSLTGERAVYDPQARTVEVEAAEGGKVTMHDQDGNVIEGPRMIYEIDQNRVHVVGRTPDAAAAPAPAPAEPANPPTPEPPPR